MELSQLEVFLAVAREHRFSRAAEKLFRTQSAVSQTIRKLEDELGEALFDRSSREGVLTDAGKVLFEYAEKLINLRGEAAESLTELRELQKGKLVIAANEFTVLYLLPLLAEFRRLHPMIKITVERALGSHIPDDVLRYSAEFGVLSYEPQEAEPAFGRRLSRRTCIRRSPETSACFRLAGQHSAAGRGVFCGAHRLLALSRESHPALQDAQNAAPHGSRTAHSAGHQTIRSHGAWRRPGPGNQRRNRDWPEENWWEFRCANCSSSESCA